MDNKHVVAGIILIALVSLALIALQSSSDRGAHYVGVPELYARNMECFHQSPKVTCTAQLCNGWDDSVTNVVVKMDVWDEWGAHYVSDESLGKLNPADSTVNCRDVSLVASTQDLGREFNVKATVSYVLSNGASVENTPLFGFTHAF